VNVAGWRVCSGHARSRSDSSRGGGELQLAGIERKLSYLHQRTAGIIVRHPAMSGRNGVTELSRNVAVQMGAGRARVLENLVVTNGAGMTVDHRPLEALNEGSLAVSMHRRSRFLLVFLG
jgi:hypothetical protein